MEHDRWETIQECSRSSRLPVSLLRDLVRAGIVREKDVRGELFLCVQDLAKVIAESCDPKRRTR
jgi:hypothetical protein